MKKRKWPAFTLIEMMISLTLFTIAMLAIVSLLTTSLKLMSTMAGADESKTQAMLLSRIMEATVRDAYIVTQNTNSSIMLTDFNQIKNVFSVQGKAILFDKYGAQGLMSRKVFIMESATAIEMKVLKNQGRQAISLLIDMPNQDINKIMLLGYKKGVSQQ